MAQDQNATRPEADRSAAGAQQAMTADDGIHLRDILVERGGRRI